MRAAGSVSAQLCGSSPVPCVATCNTQSLTGTAPIPAAGPPARASGLDVCGPLHEPAAVWGPHAVWNHRRGGQAGGWVWGSWVGGEHHDACLGLYGVNDAGRQCRSVMWATQCLCLPPPALPPSLCLALPRFVARQPPCSPLTPPRRLSQSLLPVGLVLLPACHSTRSCWAAAPSRPMSSRSCTACWTSWR